MNNNIRDGAFAPSLLNVWLKCTKNSLCNWANNQKVNKSIDSFPSVLYNKSVKK